MEFLKNNKRFSFKLGGMNAWDSDYKSEVTSIGNEVTTVYQFGSGIKITNIAKKYDKFGAYEWVNYIENTSDKPSEIISDLWDCDCNMPLKHEANRKWEAYFPDTKTATKVYAPTGSVWSKTEFSCDIDTIRDNRRINHIYPGDTKEYSASGGRSSEERAPFFNIHKDGEGYIFAIGWTGQWKCQISRANDSITFKSKIEDTFFRLMPGEKLRTSSVVIMPYKCDVADSHNKWKRRQRSKRSSLCRNMGRNENTVGS